MYVAIGKLNYPKKPIVGAIAIFCFGVMCVLSFREEHNIITDITRTSTNNSNVAGKGKSKYLGALSEGLDTSAVQPELNGLNSENQEGEKIAAVTIGESLSEPLNNTRSQAIERLSFSHVLDGTTLNDDQVPDIYANNASRFRADISLLHQAPVGQEVEIELSGEVYRAKSVSHKHHPLGVSSSRLNIGDSYPPSYIIIHTRDDGTSRGKIYTSDGNYVFFHHNQVGFLLEQNELHRLEGSPITD